MDEGRLDHSPMLVVVGASAGGIEALLVLVASLPPDFPAPIVLAQHLDPNRPSALQAILQHQSALPVIAVEAHTPLQAGAIYVVPANRHVVISDGTVSLETDHKDRPRPSVDLLLSTAAKSYGEHLIAVILTGSGSDGAQGAVAVKEAGGTIIIQNPGTARYPSMPLALPPTIVDAAVDIEQIGALLNDLVRGIHLPDTIPPSADILETIFAQVNRQANLDFRQYSHTTILRRISRRMTATHSTTLEDYAAHLEEYPAEVGNLANAFLSNITSFFRDLELYEYVKKEVLPHIIAQSHDRGRVLRLWSASCATGEEPYSLAMLLADVLGTELPQWTIKIFATDGDQTAITFARNATYLPNMLDGLPEGYRERFFEKADQGYRVIRPLRQMVVFGQHAIGYNTPFPRIDLVLCRDILMYFKPSLQKYVLNQFSYSLFPNAGYLVLGKAEAIHPDPPFYLTISKRWQIYQCLSSPLARPPSHATHVEVTQTSVVTAETAIAEIALDHLPMGVVVIDRNYRVVSTNRQARQLLDAPDLGSGLDFLHAITVLPYAQMRQAIDTAFRERTDVTLPNALIRSEADKPARPISFGLTSIAGKRSETDLVLITTSDVSSTLSAQQQLTELTQAYNKVQQQLTNISLSRDTAVNELSAVNAALQAANEELLVTQEELQAMVEEYETANEELAATNEELETHNEELQATNEELTATNEEMALRT